MDRSLDEIIAEDTPYTQDRVDLNLDWVHDKYEDDREARPSRGPRRGRRSTSPDRGPALTKVRVDNLHYDITESDLEDLFSKIGPVSALSLNYDRAGRSEGVAFITYTHLRDAHESLREFDGANAKGQPIRLTLVPGRRERNANTLFDRIERPGRDARSMSPASDAEDGSRRRRDGGRARRSDVTKPAPEHIDRYVPGKRSPTRRNGGGRRAGGRDNRARNAEDGGGRRNANGRPRKTQEELDQEMDDYWGNNNAGAEATDKPASQPADQAVPAAAASAVAPAAADDDIDMIE
ncbi:RNA binding protein [Penicillium macrosclerotiorum]|uniref:RNA binding protein n=1 Tax=Penicillium macrosclerotiorum TaxID=303699 RepID=UPI00254958C5|nr:RNA binding protein [Penicillium macrosclerotiorum]KAJ5689438.1 RNA binding protein [Penicillium macrosclerotiorum]